ncbi:MAG: hypothetical protein QME96_01770 [Myxococcota bacterium]|nr:hypothetical protein [Myxococcota bacterium]
MGLTAKLSVGALSVLLLTTGCNQEEARIRLRITADSNIRIPEQIDAVRAVATASRTESGDFCAPIVRTFPLGGPADLPLLIEFRPGSLFNSWAYFRVEWSRGGTLVNAGETWAVFPEPGAERRDATVHIDLPCVTTACGTGQVCVEGGTCRPPNDRPLDPCLNEGIPCAAEEDVFDIGGRDAGECDAAGEG